MFRLDGKSALVTGGTSGIGLATGQLFAAQGARVLVCGRHPQATEAGSLRAERCDVTQPAERARLVGLVGRDYGGLDVLFVNAGLADFPRFEEVTEERFDALMDLNFKAAFFTIQDFFPLLRPGASVILTTSTANAVGMARLALYGASKAALGYLARGLSAELAPHGIRVNAISPGPTETPIHGKYAALLSQEALGELGSATMARNVAGRMAQASEIAAAALYLASDASSFMRGHELVVDGGISL